MVQFFGQYHIRAPVTDEYVDAVFREIDANRDNKIQLEELQGFATIFVKKMIKLFNAALTKGGEQALADQSPGLAKQSSAADDEEEKKEGE